MERVLVISPHPDDESIGCGGTLHRYATEGATVKVAFLTSGEQGGHGVVTVSGNVAPAKMAELCRLASAGEHDAAKVVDDLLQPLNTALFLESNPIPVKWAVSQMGMIAGHIRLPLTPFSEQYHEQMRAAMSGAGVEIPT